jgi:hypothetical protein
MRKIREPYQVPENYFQDLEQGILNKTVQKKPRISLRWILTAAASVVVVLGIWFFGLRNEVNPTSGNIYAGVDDYSTEIADIQPLLSSEDLAYVLAGEKDVEEIETDGAIIKEPMNVEDEEIEDLMVAAGLVSLELDEDLLGDIEI